MGQLDILRHYCDTFCIMVHKFVSSNWPHRPPLSLARWAGQWPLCCCAISHTHLTNGNLQMRNPINFLNFQISHRATLHGLNLLFFLVHSQDDFWVPCFFSPVFFLCFSFSPLSDTLQFLPIFISQMYLLLLMSQSLWPFCCFFSSLSDNYSFELKSTKRHSMWKDSWLMYH